MQQFPTYSPAVFEFSWWWVIVGVGFWAFVLWVYVRTFHGKAEKERWANKGAARRERKAAARSGEMHAALAGALGDARLARRDEAAAGGPRPAAATAATAEQAAETARNAAATRPTPPARCCPGATARSWTARAAGWAPRRTRKRRRPRQRPGARRRPRRPRRADCARE